MKLDFNIGDEVFIIVDDLAKPIQKVEIVSINIDETGIEYRVSSNIYSRNIMQSDESFCSYDYTTDLVFPTSTECKIFLNSFVNRATPFDNIEHFKKQEGSK